MKTAPLVAAVLALLPPATGPQDPAPAPAWAIWVPTEYLSNAERDAWLDAQQGVLGGEGTWLNRMEAGEWRPVAFGALGLIAPVDPEAHAAAWIAGEPVPEEALLGPATALLGPGPGPGECPECPALNARIARQAHLIRLLLLRRSRR